MRNNLVALIAILLFSIAAIYVALPIDHMAWLEQSVSWGSDQPRDLRDINRGLDLQGGTQVLLESNLPEGVPMPEGAMDIARRIVENRVNGLGVTEPTVQNQGTDRIIVELPGIANPDQAINTLRSTGQLEFVEPAGLDLSQGMIINTTNRPNAVAETQAAIAEGIHDPVALPYPDTVFETIMTGDILRDARPTRDQFGQWIISFELTSDGSDQFFEYTRNHIGSPLPIILDGEVLSAPVIQAAIQGSGQITGQFGEAEADSLAIQMRYGALPIPLQVVDVRTIGATLGQDSVDRSIRAGILGMAMVLVFMLLLYRLPGLLANVALIIYVALNIAILKLVPVTVTLPGIAGFLLSIGMAVDANILIFERMKEELRTGRSLRLAVEAGFSRAWPAIRDGNVSTLLSCIVLFWFGSNFGASVVKGFAVTLAIGVVLSMFTAVVVTRTFMRTFLPSSGERSHNTRSLLGY